MAPLMTEVTSLRHAIFMKKLALAQAKGRLSSCHIMPRKKLLNVQVHGRMTMIIAY